MHTPLPDRPPRRSWGAHPSTLRSTATEDGPRMLLDAPFCVPPLAESSEPARRSWFSASARKTGMRGACAPPFQLRLSGLVKIKERPMKPEFKLFNPPMASLVAGRVLFLAVL